MVRETVLDAAIFNIRGYEQEDELAPSLDDNTGRDESAIIHGATQRQGVVPSDFASKVCYLLSRDCERDLPVLAKTGRV